MSQHYKYNFTCVQTDMIGLLSLVIPIKVQDSNYFNWQEVNEFIRWAEFMATDYV